MSVRDTELHNFNSRLFVLMWAVTESTLKTINQKEYRLRIQYGGTYFTISLTTKSTVCFHSQKTVFCPVIENF
jgi:hypothetical protein